MPISNALLTDIQSTIGSLPSNLTSASAIDNIYEVYLFSLVLQAAQNEGATIRLRDQTNTSPTTLFFRSSPGYLASNIHNYSFAEVIFANKPALEAHISVRISGRSSVLHECDICVILKSEADLCRRAATQMAPRSSKIILNVEAKFYTTSLSLHLGRSFLGLITDLSSGKSFFITNTSSTSIEKLLSHKQKSWEHNIKPGNVALINRLVSALQVTFRDFKAKN